MEAQNIDNAVKFNFKLLKFTFGIVPIVAGLDKFINLLTDWDKYLHPGIKELSPVSPEAFMMIIGVIEIIAGLIVLVKTEAGAYIVAAWLTLVAVSLISSGQFIDVAVRDLVMAISAFSLAKIARYKMKYE